MDVSTHAGSVNNFGHNSLHLEAPPASVGSLKHQITQTGCFKTLNRCEMYTDTQSAVSGCPPCTLRSGCLFRGACLLDGEGLEVAGEESVDVPAHAPRPLRDVLFRYSHYRS